MNRFLFLAFYPSYSLVWKRSLAVRTGGCSAINHDVLNNLESIRELHCGTPLSRTWFVGGIYHTNSPEVISIFTRQSVLHTSHLENSWLLPITHKWRLTFRLGRGHIHYVKKYHRLFFFIPALPMHMEQQPGLNANEKAPVDMMYTVRQYGTDVF